MCDSPVELAIAGVSVMVTYSDINNQNVLCSNCTAILEEVKKQLRRSSIAVVVRSSEGLITMGDPSKLKS
jgi:hypothetical protein